ncbi:MAG: DUF937 domain-containing protein [Actinobacteria bacterium]|nr:DUF937 domain-containing protein [Actinomycetota bacterium]
MATIDDLLAQIPMDQLARQLGVPPDEAEELTRQALPALLGGMEANAQEPGGETSLAEAIGQHDDDLLDGGVDLDRVDTDDGQKIVRHVFGENRNEVISRLGGGGKESMMSSLLPLLAPLVMSFLAKKAGGGSGAGSTGGGGIGDLLGGLLGGGSGGGGIEDLLGGLLGGGRKG